MEWSVPSRVTNSIAMARSVAGRSCECGTIICGQEWDLRHSVLRALDGLIDEALMLADGVSLARVFDKLKSADGQGRGNGWIDFDRSRLHE